MLALRQVTFDDQAGAVVCAETEGQEGSPERLKIISSVLKVEEGGSMAHLPNARDVPVACDGGFADAAAEEAVATADY
jgi:hypothetical protein